jgi:predicted metal-dependent phosphoesterase TrpH
MIAICGLLLLAAVRTSPAHEGERVIDESYHHLGDTPTKDWPEASEKPEGTRLDVEFTSRANEGEWALAVRQRDVDDRWAILLDGAPVGELKRSKEQQVAWYPLPAGSVHEGANVLSFVPDKATDDVTLGDVRLVERTLREHLGLRPVSVRVVDEATGAGLPVRLAVTDEAGALLDLYYAESPKTAVRRGIVYTLDGAAAFELPPGRYRVHALRGMEWSHAAEPLELAPNGQGEVALALALRREVDTKGFIAADTHVHTYTFSGHGDSTVEERMITLAGEGVELAVATDHNHQTDYRPYQEKMGLSGLFTPVTGNEVTTENGHFNAFPLDPGGPVPDHRIADWVRLVDGIRAKGAKVVILNHPRWPGIDTGPLGVFAFDRISGERHDGPAFTFDAMEIANSTALLEDPRYVLRDWFAILNHGERIGAVGTSDSHTVGDPVGQGRTYVRSSTDDPARIDVDEVCAAFRRGDTTISLGMFADVVVAGRCVPGSVAPVGREPVSVALRVAAPSWVVPKAVDVYVDGELVHVEPLEVHRGRPFDRRLELTLPPRRNDGWLVCFVLGEGVRDPCWRTQHDYTLAATNPVWLDVDGDGAYASPREQARGLVEQYAGDLDALRAQIERRDTAVGVQVLSLVRERVGTDRDTLDRLAGSREDPANRTLWSYLESLPGQDDE